jgi:hypothetical protein
MVKEEGSQTPKHLSRKSIGFLHSHMNARRPLLSPRIIYLLRKTVSMMACVASRPGLNLPGFMSIYIATSVVHLSPQTRCGNGSGRPVGIIHPIAREGDGAFTRSVHVLCTCWKRAQPRGSHYVNTSDRLTSHILCTLECSLCYSQHSPALKSPLSLSYHRGFHARSLCRRESNS